MYMYILIVPYQELVSIVTFIGLYIYHYLRYIIHCMGRAGS